MIAIIILILILLIAAGAFAYIYFSKKVPDGFDSFYGRRIKLMDVGNVVYFMTASADARDNISMKYYIAAQPDIALTAQDQAEIIYKVSKLSNGYQLTPIRVVYNKISVGIPTGQVLIRNTGGAAPTWTISAGSVNTPLILL